MLSSRGRKQKGDRAEREVLTFLRDQLGEHVVRARLEGDNDHGDITGLADLTVQVKSYQNLGRAIREALDELVGQKANAGTPWGAGFIRRPGGRYLVVMSPDDFVSLYREATLGGKPNAA